MALHYEGWEVDVAHNGEDAVAKFNADPPDVLILDIMLPDIDGLQILRWVREAEHYTPTLFLTARDSVTDRVTGLTAGADDYMTKPFSLEELVARLRGLMRRSQYTDTAPSDDLTVGELTLDAASRRVSRGGTEIDLTATEFELLRYLMRNHDRAIGRAEILDRVWHYGFDGRTSIVDLYISYLRKKIDKGRKPIIHTCAESATCCGPRSEHRGFRRRCASPLRADEPMATNMFQDRAPRRLHRYEFDLN